MSQLELPLSVPRYDRLCGTLPITPAEPRPDGSLVSLWLRGPASKYGDKLPAWKVEPVPEDCLAWENGARWFYYAATRTITAVGSCSSSGPMKGTRDEVAAHAQDVLLRLDRRRR